MRLSAEPEQRHSCWAEERAAIHPPRPSLRPLLSPVSTVGYGSWFEHVQEFWEHHMDSNVLFLKDEDMHRVSAWGWVPQGRVLRVWGRVLRGGCLGGVS